MYTDLINSLQSEAVMEKLTQLYGTRDGMLALQQSRYANIITLHKELFHAETQVYCISAPGRTEIGGNHTDHNKGKVLAAAVNLDTLAAVSARSDMLVHLHSEGYPAITVDLSNLSVCKEEEGTTAALIRGVAAGMQQAGYAIGGFDAAVTSTVASGSGLSSSAAFEVMVSAIFDKLYNTGDMPFVQQAKISQYAENVYFGKPSGLLDQMASAAGGLVYVDFQQENPEVQPLAYDFAKEGYALVVVGTGGSHANLTDHYAAIPSEMKQVAACLGAKVLREVPYETFLAELPALRKKVNDRCLLRAMHFYEENTRVERQLAALQENRLPDFFTEILASGRSSFMYLQNVYAFPTEQSLSLALALAEKMLSGRGAWRIHGGGFAGTTLNFVPQDLLPTFIATMESAFGKDCCHVLDIRPQGAAVIG